MSQRIVFMGTSTFSLAVLRMLLDEGYDVVGVVTQPDRPVGRKKKLTPSVVKQLSLEKGLPVIQPEKIRTDYQDILDLKPDLIITAAYGQIVPKVLLEAPRLRCINVHASLLPKYRGGAPVHQAIIDGEEKTGVTIMYMEMKMDAGDIISQRETLITDDDTVGILYDRLSDIGAELLRDTLPSILEGTNNRTPQDESQVTYAPTLKREDEHLNWNMSAREVFNRVRGTDPWPGTYTVYKGMNIKIWAGKIHACENARKHHAHQECGTIVKLFKDAIGVKVTDGVYLITELQVPGKRRMSVKDYMNGKCIFEEDTMFE